MSDKSANFNLYASYYDLLYRDKDYKEEVNYVHDLITSFEEVPTNSILDLGCGTGAHDHFLANKGYKITGIDLSHQMIDIANDEADNTKYNGGSAEFHQGDIRDVALDRQFDTVVSLFHVVGYLKSNEDVAKFFDVAKNHLKKGGLLIFDHWYGPGVLSDMPHLRVKEFENTDTKIHRIATPEMFPNENMVEVNYKFLVTDKKNSTMSEFEEKHEVRYFFLPEMLHMANQYGFEHLAFYKWMSRGVPELSSWFVVHVLRKL